jgi:hypothetical protein
VKKADVFVGGIYAVKISGQMSPVRLWRECYSGGWEGINLYTGRNVRIRSAGKLRNALTPRQVRAIDGIPDRDVEADRLEVVMRGKAVMRGRTP